MTKAKDFRIFCQILRMISQGEHLKESGLKKIYRIKQRMH
jgi:hypothetical protein